MAGMRDEAITAGFDIGTMILLLDDARQLIDEVESERAASWLLDHADWLRRENARQASQDEPREWIDRPEREQEPTYVSTTRERDAGWKAARDSSLESIRSGGYYPPEKRALKLGQAHIDVHAAWRSLGAAEARRDVLHRHYGYPAAES